MINEIVKALIFALITSHITTMCVTIYLHRSMAHRSVELNPFIAFLMRFWLWIGTGMITKEWIACHRKHHSFADVEGDPHSPRLVGLPTVVFKGMFLYTEAVKDKEMVERYGKGAPDDWFERHIYSKYRKLGILFLLAVDIWLFPSLWVGLMIWGIQMVWIPFWAAGVVNGIGHAWGYRNFKSNDLSHNFSPFGILLAGEELHNNHHADITSARFSRKWWEVDFGWIYIQILSLLGLAKIEPARTTA